jgi:para-nitrobenzyl esterase
MNVFSLLAAPAARGLFQRAIVQSGLPVSEPVQGARASRRNGPPPPAAVAFAPRELDRPYGSHDLVSRLLLNASRVATPDAADALQASLPPRELAQWLRALPAGDVLAPFGWTDGAVKTFAALYPWPAPIADGVVLPSEPLLQVFADPARYNAVPIILGTNRDEAKLFLSVDPLYVDLWFGRLPRLRDAARYDRDAAYASDFWRAIGADEPATRMRAGSGPNVYVYRLDWDDTLQNPVIDLARIFGAAHGLDIPLLFGADNAFSRPFLPANAAARRDRDRLAAAMKSYWGAFAHDGAPGRGQGGTLPEWTPWPATSGTAGDTLVFDSPAGGGLRMVPGRLTPAGLEQRLLVDPTLAADLAERCRLHASMFQLIGGAAGLWDPAHHASLGCTK